MIFLRTLKKLQKALVGLSLLVAGSAFALTSSTTTLVSSINPLYVGQNTVLTATVSPSSAEGTITFKSGTKTLGRSAISAGVATLSKNFTVAGTENLTASYAGDTINAASVSPIFVQTVQSKVTTSVAFASSVNPVLMGQDTVLTATVTGSNPTGTVTFRNGATSLGRSPLIGNVATLTKSFPVAGAQNLTAVYGGDVVNSGATSDAFAQTVSPKALSSVSLVSSANPSHVGQAVSFSATVLGNNPGGTVLFRNGAVSLGRITVSNGLATLTRTFTNTETLSVTAAYSGDDFNATSTSAILSQSVEAKSPTSIVLTSGINPSYVLESVTLGVTVSGDSPMGTVTFKNGSSVLGRRALVNGSAVLVASFRNAGISVLTATYGGDGANLSSTSDALNQSVQARATTTVFLTSSPNPADIGQQVNLSATIESLGITSPTGVVTFLDGTTTIGTANINNGAANLVTTFNIGGIHRLRARYQGDTEDAPRNSAVLRQTVRGPSGSSVTNLSSNANPAGVNQPIVLEADITGTNPTGIVTFREGSTVLGTASVVNAPPPLLLLRSASFNRAQNQGANFTRALATLTVSFASAGTRNLTAEYAGDGTNFGSTSDVFAQVVDVPAPSAVTLTASSNPVGVQRPVELYATVTGSNPSGLVTFKDGGAVLGVGEVREGVASIVIEFSTTGTHSLSAAYDGDYLNLSSNSNVLNEEVIPFAISSINLTVSPNPVLTGGVVQLSAVINGSNPSGAVYFFSENSVLGMVPVTSSGATFTTSFATTGIYNLIAYYPGDTGNSESISNVVAENVDASLSGQAGEMTWLYGYDPQGNLLLKVDPKGNQTNNSYDNLYRLVQIAKPAPAGSSSPTLIGMSYDAQGNLSQVVDPRSLATSYVTDGLNNVRSTASPDTGVTSATYDAADNLKTKTDSRGITSSYSYDALNRLTAIAYPSGVPTQFQYDGGGAGASNSIGRLTRINDEAGSTVYTYDELGRVLTKTQTVGGRIFTIGYTWGSSGSSLGHLTAITYPSGSKINYGYDGSGRVNSVTVNPVNANGVGSSGSMLNVLSGLSYNAQDDAKGWTWGNGVSYQRSFDSFGRLSSYPLGNPTGTGNAEGLLRTLSYDATGQITKYTHFNAGAAKPAFDQSFAYDDLGQLNAVAQSSASYGYSYDAGGNRTMRVVSGASYPFTVAPDSNRLMQAQSASGQTSFSYDNAGNMLVDGAANYTYSARGRMSSATVGTNVVSYLYNGLNQRVNKVGSIVPSGVAYYAYDEVGQLIGEYDANSNPIYETVYLGSMPVATIKQSGTAASSNIQVSVFNVYADHLNTARVITSSVDETIVWRWDNAEAFGATPATVDPSGVGVFAYNPRFPGQIYDAETGNYYNWHRDLKPSLGRYAQSDPIGLAGGVNTFAYVGGSPLMFSDPMGLQVLPFPPPPIPGVPNPSLDAQRDLAERLSRPSKKDAEITYQTYTRYNPLTGDCYSGRTSGDGTPEQNVRNRGYGQPLLNAEGFMPPVLDQSSPDKDAIRGREQQIIDLNGGARSSGGSSRNMINGISPWNFQRQNYLDAATNQFGTPVPAGRCRCQ